MSQSADPMLNRRELVLATGVAALAASVPASTHADAAPNAWARAKKRAAVLGRRMAYVERGSGAPIVFLHGNPTSLFLWRNVLPHVEAPGRRLIAPDLIGMGDSDKIPASEPDRYRFQSHARYLEAFLDVVLGPNEPAHLVLHDWGGALGFDWAFRRPERVRGIAYCETFVRPLTLADLPESFHATLTAVRSEEGRRLVLDENMFIEKMLPGVTQRALAGLEIAGRVRIGLVEDLTIAGLPDRLATFAKSYPGVALDIAVDQSPALEERLFHGSLDLAVMELRRKDQKPFASWTQPLRWVAAPGATLAPHDEVPLVLLERDGPDPWREALLAELKRRGFRPRVAVTTKSVSAVLATVTAGLGLAVVPDRVAIAVGLRPVNPALGLPDPGTIAFGVLTSSFTTTDPAAMALATFLGGALGTP